MKPTNYLLLLLKQNVPEYTTAYTGTWSVIFLVTFLPTTSNTIRPLSFPSEIWLSYIIPVLESVVSDRFCNPNHRLGFKHESILHVICGRGTREVIGANQYLNLALPST